MMSPVVDALSEEMSEVVVGKINVDEEPGLAQQFNVLSIPTFMIFKSGQVVDQFSGAMSKDALRQRIEKHF
jgi:thioredoxin 1